MSKARGGTEWGEKSPVENTAPDDGKRQFEADVEKSKQNAVERFPDLGVAGSEMNKAFVARVKHLRALNSPEFNYPTWPYQLACQVDYEVQSAKQVADRQAKEAADSAHQKSKNDETINRRFTVAELLQEKKIPFAEISLSGMVTKLEAGVAGVGNAVTGTVIIDQKVRCLFELPSRSGLNRIELVTRKNTIFCVTKDSKTFKVLAESPLFRLGQHVVLKGRMQQNRVDGSLVLDVLPSQLQMGAGGF